MFRAVGASQVERKTKSFRARCQRSDPCSITWLLGILREVPNLSVHSSLICKTRQGSVLLVILVLLLSLVHWYYYYYFQIILVRQNLYCWYYWYYIIIGTIIIGHIGTIIIFPYYIQISKESSYIGKAYCSGFM